MLRVREIIRVWEWERFGDDRELSVSQLLYTLNFFSSPWLPTSVSLSGYVSLYLSLSISLSLSLFISLSLSFSLSLFVSLSLSIFGCLCLSLCLCLYLSLSLSLSVSSLAVSLSLSLTLHLLHAHPLEHLLTSLLNCSAHLKLVRLPSTIFRGCLKASFSKSLTLGSSLESGDSLRIRPKMVLCSIAAPAIPCISKVIRIILRLIFFTFDLLSEY